MKKVSIRIIIILLTTVLSEGALYPMARFVPQSVKNGASLVARSVKKLYKKYPKLTIAAGFFVAYSAANELYNVYDKYRRASRKKSDFVPHNGRNPDNTATLFAHGFGAPNGDSHAIGYKNHHVGAVVAPTFQDGEQAGRQGKAMALYVNTCMGQGGDAHRLAQALHGNAGLVNKDIVLHGVSRGGAAAFNLLAHGSAADISGIKAVILEVPLVSLSLVVDNILAAVRNQTGGIIKVMTQAPGLSWAAHKFIAGAVLPNYRTGGLTMLDLAPYIPKNMPILILTARGDTLIPYRGSVALYKKLRALGHEHVYLWVADDDGFGDQHNRMVDSFRHVNGTQQTYADAIAAFQQAYYVKAKNADVDHQAILASCQPTEQQLTAWYGQ